MRLPGTPALRGDHHDAVRAARAVDRGGGGILQDVDRLDLVGVDAGDGGDILAAHAELRVVLLDDRDAVDDVERLVAGVDRRWAAHAHGDAVAGVAGVLHHLNARRLTLERSIDACRGSVRDLRCRDGRDRAADVLAARGAVADDDDLGQRASYGDEREVGRDGRTRADGHAYVAGREPDALRADRDGAGGDVADGVFAGVVRERSDLRADDGDLRAGHGASTRRRRVGGQHGASDRSCLGLRVGERTLSLRSRSRHRVAQRSRRARCMNPP